MDSTLFPLAGLRLKSADVELRYITYEDAEKLAWLQGQHQGYDPFAPWLAHQEDRPVDRGRRFLQHLLRRMASVTPDHWALELAPIVDGEPVGFQTILSNDFLLTREAMTSSWLAPEFRGRGIGTAMRSAVLHLGFVGFGARYLTSGAALDNGASIAVTKRLGYVDDGFEQNVLNGHAALMRRFRLGREDWEASDRPEVEIEGLEPCLPLLGL